MVLKTKFTGGRDTVIGESFPFTAITTHLPIFGPFLKREKFFSVQPVLNISILVKYHRGVPFSRRVHLFGFRYIHSVVATRFLPVFQSLFSGLADPRIVIVIDQLVFRAGKNRSFVLRPFLYVI